MKVQFINDGFNDRIRRSGQELSDAFKALGDTLQRIKQDHPEFYKHLTGVKSK